MHEHVELLAIGAGPSNLALAVALEELAPDLAENSLLIERNSEVVWQPGLLLPWATSQISFLKDLVTLRNPTSEFSFVNFLHSVGRLDDFVNLGNVWPHRSEISEYLAWVAGSLSKVEVRLGQDCLRLEPSRDGDGVLEGWICHLANGSTISCRYLVIAVGRDPHIPPTLATLPAERVVHGNHYTSQLSRLNPELPYRVAVLGGAQSAAEMFLALQQSLPNAEVNWVMRGIAPSVLQSSQFSNERYYPDVVDTVYGASTEVREKIRREMHRTNYSGVEPDLLERIYADRYVNQAMGTDRTKLITMVDLVGAIETDDGIELELVDRSTGDVHALPLDLVFLGTGFDRTMPALVKQLTADLQLARTTVSRRYRLVLDEVSDAACYLQGVNEDTHGVGDSLFSVIADRTAATVMDILTDRELASTRR